jgi:hypothetical protein
VQVPWLALVLGLLLGLCSTVSAGWVARGSHACGLRQAPPPPLWRWLAMAGLDGLASFTVASLTLGWEARALLLGAGWGYLGMDFAHHARAAVARRGVATDPDSLAAWQALPPRARHSLVGATGIAVSTMMALAFLIKPDIALLGFLFGAFGHLLGQRRASVQAMLAAAVIEESATGLTSGGPDEPRE